MKVENDIKYSFGVISSTMKEFVQWRNEKFNAEYIIRTSNNQSFSYNEIQYYCISTEVHARGYRFDGMIETDLAKDNRHYHDILNCLIPSIG